MADEKIKYWLALTRLKGLGGAALKDVLTKHKDPEALFEGAGAASCLPEEARLSLRGFGAWSAIEDEIALMERGGVSAVTFHSEEYPPLLREINDPPAVLFVKGAIARLKGLSSAAVVGTRRPTHYGLKMSGAIAGGLASAGVAVVSGMARGCDTEAHKAALTAGGITVAVLGTGVDAAYPPENARLYEEITDKGVAISEFPIGTKPQPYNFPRRNRIISGLSLGVVVVEAPLRSGALMTARLALDYNRDVFAVPGHATSDKSRGTNKLIKEGAGLVECAEDVLSQLGIGAGQASLRLAPERSTAEFGGDERLIFEALGAGELDIDALTEATGLSPAKASSVLMGMELKGIVGQAPGKRFSRR